MMECAYIYGRTDGRTHGWTDGGKVRWTDEGVGVDGNHGIDNDNEDDILILVQSNYRYSLIYYLKELSLCSLRHNV